jgi:hypothetical protein
MAAVTDAPHRLLLSHFTTWLRAKDREVDDLGIFSQTENEIALTSWGDVFVSSWLSDELAATDDDR